QAGPAPVLNGNEPDSMRDLGLSLFDMHWPLWNDSAGSSIRFPIVSGLRQTQDSAREPCEAELPRSRTPQPQAAGGWGPTGSRHSSRAPGDWWAEPQHI